MIDAKSLEELAGEAGLAGAGVILERLSAPRGAVRLAPPESLYPASMIKVPIGLVLASLCARGVRRLEETARVGESNLTANDAPSAFSAGHVATLGALAHGMIADSDNVATNVLIDELGREQITAECVALGLAGTAVRRKLSGSLPLIADPAATGRNTHPLEDAAAAFRTIAACADPWVAFLYRALLAQRWNDKLSRGFSSGDRFAHKTGDTDQVSHDGGILELPGGQRYTIVVYTALPSGAATDDRFAAFARALRARLA